MEQQTAHSCAPRLLRACVAALLVVPRLVWAICWHWNPLVAVPRRLLSLLRALMDSLAGGKRTAPASGAASGSGGPDTRRWLSPGERGGERVAIASYPRSGNSLLRGLLEAVTGVYTGCDTRPDRALSRELQSYGLKGEGVVDDSVWLVKTHFPERVGWQPFAVRKALVVVRNPWDAIDSYFNMTLTNSHNTSVHESQYARFADRWDGMLRNEVDVWMQFHRFWTTKADVPVMVVRYEDLLVHRAETLRRVLLFLEDRATLDGTDWEARIQAVVAAGADRAGPYKPRSGKIGASFRHYSPEQFRYILNAARLPLRGFGYDTETQSFPGEIRLPRRQVRPGKTPDARLEISTDVQMEVRRRNDIFGRGSTWFRKTLTEPVIASDGTELNMDEVLAARQKAKEEQVQEQEREQDKLAPRRDDSEEREA